MNTKSTIVTVLAVLLASGAGWWAWRSQGNAGSRQTASPVAGVAGPAPEDLLSAALSRAQRSHDSPEDVKALEDLRTALLGLERGQAVAWIRGQLATGEDFSTGRDLALGRDGSLADWPSLRVFLLDVIFSIDPAAAADMGRKVLRSPTSPDEWALAMRNLGAGSPPMEDVTLLKTKSAELLHNETWRKEASAGYLQAFDVIVHTKNITLSPDLIQFAGDMDNKAVRHAAFLTLDRLTLAEPVAMLEKLIPSASAQPETAVMVSNMVARADVRDPAQRRLVEGYLLDENRTAAEIQSFAGVFPNANQFVSPNLLTKVATVSGSELAAHDRVALEVVGSWVNDPRFVRLQPALRGTQGRLKSFVTP